MDYDEEEENARYAEELAASSDPLDSLGGVDSNGFRQPHLQDWELDEQTQADIRDFVGGQQEQQGGRRDERGWTGLGLERFEELAEDDIEMHEASSPTPSSSQQALTPSTRDPFCAQQPPGASHYSRIPPLPHAPLPRRPVAKPHTSFKPLRPAPMRQLQPAAAAGLQGSHGSGGGFPIPANGNVNRRMDFHLRPAAGGSHFQPQLGGHYADSQPARRVIKENDRYRPAEERIEEVGEGQEEEPDYFGDDDEAFETALVQQTATAAPGPAPRANPSTQRPQPGAPQARYRDAAPPAPRQNPTLQAGGVKLRPVSDLPNMFRGMFKFPCFNVIQSTCFDTIYQSDENVVVSAPTGSGKTVLFELAILRLFSTSDSNDAKAVYMAPTKALTSERAVDWKKKFEQLGLGWTVAELTGDTSPGPDVWKSIKKSRLIVTTPEKWDSITRSWHNHDRSFSQLALFCIDECHSVGMDVRGATLEVVVSRMKTLGTNTRFIAVSATVPNVHDVAEWLGSGDDTNAPATVYEFNESYRPCKLQRIVIGYPPKDNDFSFNSALTFKLYDLLKQYSAGKPVLIFCNTRKACSQAAEVLAKEYKQAVEARRPDLPWRKPARSDFKTTDKKLAVLIESGIAYHHAGLELQDRKIVESLFTSSAISVVCATSTLATGVNLPARMVIIKGTKMFKGAPFEEYTDMDVLQGSLPVENAARWTLTCSQMIGRAGRPQFDTSGVALIMTESPLQSHYEDLVNSQTMLESCLHKNLTEHINSEITLRTITNVPSALHWLRSTFLFVRIKKNSRYYSIAGGTATSPDARLEEIVVEAVKDLVSNGIVDESDDVISPTTYGDMMAKNYLSQPTFVSLKNLPSKPNMRTLLETVSAGSEFSQTRFRQGEKGALAKVNKNLKYPVAKLVTSADKVMILIQIVLECIPGADVKLDNFNPHAEAGGLWQQLTRMVRCIVDVLLERRDGAVRVGCELLRSIHAKAWDSSPFILRQIDGVGEKSVKALVDAGITTFADMRNSDPSRLELLLGRNPPFGRKLIALATAFPQFSISVEAEEEEVVDTGIKITLNVEISVEQTSPSCLVKKNGSMYYACVVLHTSDGEYIDFRRIRLEQLVASGVKKFTIAVIVCRPSQRIIGSISCDHVAGSEVRASLKPSTSPSLFPLPAAGADEVEPEVEETPVEVPVPRQVQSKPIAAAPAEAEPKPARKRPDGRYDCNHSCKDKSVCKHLCCRDGLDDPPVVRRRKVKTPKDTGETQTTLDALSKTKSTVVDSLAKTPALKSSLLSPRTAVELGKPLKAFNGKTLKQLIAEGSDGEKGEPRVEKLDESDDDLLSLEQLLMQNKKKRSARDAQLEQPVSAPKLKQKKALPVPVAAPSKRKAIDVLSLFASDDDQEIDQLEDDSDLDRPLPSPKPKRAPLRRASRSTSSKLAGRQDILVSPAKSPEPCALFRSDSPAAAKVDAEETLTEITTAAETIEDDPQEMHVEVKEDGESGMEGNCSPQQATAVDSDDDLEEWLASCVVVKE